jgi:hypothetical protein
MMCPACPAALTLIVQTPNQQPVPDVTIVGAPTRWRCEVADETPRGAATMCFIYGGPGTLDLEVSAPGFQSKSVHDEIATSTDECCGCGYVPETDAHALTRQPT